jgi:shikimate kinase
MATDDRPIFLVGFMGSGKSAVGQSLAARLNRDFVDTDQLVVEREGRSIDGRDLVVAAGGGLFLGWCQRRWLGEQGRTVWLDVPLDVARQRVGKGRTRPLWFGRDPLDLRAFFDKRRAVYALAELHVPAHPGSVEEVAERVLLRLDCIFR